MGADVGPGFTRLSPKLPACPARMAAFATRAAKFAPGTLAARAAPIVTAFETRSSPAGVRGTGRIAFAARCGRRGGTTEIAPVTTDRTVPVLATRAVVAAVGSTSAPAARRSFVLGPGGAEAEPLQLRKV
jgi:hypothetical protein